MDIHSATYFSLSVEDRPGELARIMGILKKEHINLSGMWGFGIGEGKAQILLIPKDPEQCRDAMSRAEQEVTEGTCFRVTEEDRMGALVEILEKIGTKGINLHAVDAISVQGEFGCYLWAEQVDVKDIQQLLES